MITSNFPVTHNEYSQLDEKYSSLLQFIGWQLIKKNTRNNHTDEQEDVVQDLRISLIRAGSYYKRQIYIEKCLELCKKYVKNDMLKNMLDSLDYLWNNKTKHGAGRQSFGPFQEALLEKLVKKVVPKKERPSKTEPLKIDSKFSTYCKSIVWNQSKQIGRNISKTKSFRNSQVSLSYNDFLI